MGMCALLDAYVLTGKVLAFTQRLDGGFHIEAGDVCIGHRSPLI